MKCARIRDLREDKDLTQQKVADLLHISRSTYSAYENGANSAPLEILVALADLHKTSVDYILGLTDVKTPYPRKR
ncbi:MAG: helix-turn-helix transcriptional regulator [Clostridia bacterium]